MSKVDRNIRLLVFITWLLFQFYGFVNHVYWRDEVRALSIALSSNSYFDLFFQLKNEGHPVLWYFLLKVFYSLFQSPLVLGSLSLLFAIGFNYILLFKSKIHWLFVLLIVFGFYSVYEYSINSRNYGISVFLMFLFAYGFSKNKGSLLPLICLVLLPQTNFYATMFTPVFLALYCYNSKKLNKFQVILSCLVVVSVVISIITCLPNEQSLVAKKMSWDTFSWVHLWDVGIGFPMLLDLPFAYNRELTTLLLLFSLLLFVKRKSFMLAAFLLLLIMSFFHQNIRENYLHHQGVYLFAFIALIIAEYNHLFKDFNSKLWVKNIMILGIVSFSVILIGLFYKGYEAYNMELKFANSNADNFGRDLQQTHHLNRIIISEPDYIMESVMYYYPNSYYLPRENKKAYFTRFTRQNKDSLSLKDLLNVSDSLTKEGKSVDFVFGWLLPDTNFTYRFSYNKKLHLDTVSLKRFHKEFKLYKSYDHWIKHDEYYYWYRKE